MKTEWDYTSLADAYSKRPDYSREAVTAMLKIANVQKDDNACDIGAGVAHLTLTLASYGLHVVAIEPNDAMRMNGRTRTSTINDIHWFEGTGENTGRENKEFSIVTFGSSFNACNRELALKEASRILKNNGWFACMWNHRNLDDKIQNNIERIIQQYIPSYNYGARREDQTRVIKKSNLFSSILRVSGDVTHKQSISDVIEAWKSHATLQRQAGDNFFTILDKIESFLVSLNQKKISVPYTTNIWMAQKI